MKRAAMKHAAAGVPIAGGAERGPKVARTAQPREYLDVAQLKKPAPNHPTPGHGEPWYAQNPGGIYGGNPGMGGGDTPGPGLGKEPVSGQPKVGGKSPHYAPPVNVA